MKIYNVEKTKQLEQNEINLKDGYLRPDKIIVAHHEATEAILEQGHYETVAEYPSGGKDVKWIVDVPGVDAKDAWDEYEEIQVYVLYTAEEKQRLYENKVDSLIRSKYTLSQELAILRQQESKSDEYKAYFDFCEQCKINARKEIYGDEI